MDIRAKIQKLLAQPHYHPLRRAELAGALALSPAERHDFHRVLKELLDRGEVVRVRTNRFVLPGDADLVAGRIEFNERGFAFVIPEPAPPQPGAMRASAPVADVYVSEEDTGVAMHGDRVVIRLNRARGQAHGRARGADRPSGRVIRILERARETIVGTLEKTKYFLYVIPDDPRLIHDIYTTATLQAQVGDKVVVKLAPWEHRHVNPEGEIVEVLGRADKPGVDILAIIRKHHLATEFSEKTLSETERIPERIPDAERTRRRDLRQEFIITIDPDDAKDFDDAVQVDELPQGGWRLGVHIADVSYYIPPGSALDREAHERGNSVYLVDRVLPMLPEKLSNNLCSLRPKEDRLVQSCFIEFDPTLKVRNMEFASSIICSRHRLTYKEAFARLQSATAADELTAELKKMWGLASRLRAQRYAHGALDLDFPEVKVRLGPDGKPTGLEKVENDISHQLVEEFMLVANEAVAREVAQRQVPCLYRIHEDPALEKLKDFRAYAQGFGYKVGDVTHRQELQKLLDHVADKPEKYAIHLALLRSLKRAQYSPQPIGHYGLAKKFYLHFTSPIRRYADLVAHRVLVALRGEPAGHRYPLTELGRTAEHISRTERVADEAEKESVELKKIEYFLQQLTTGQLDELEAVVCTVRNFGIFVELPQSLVQGLVHISTLDDDFYQYDEERERLVGRRSGRVIQIGDKLRVQVERVDVFKRQIDFRIIPDGTPRGKPTAPVARKPSGERFPAGPEPGRRATATGRSHRVTNARQPAPRRRR